MRALVFLGTRGGGGRKYYPFLLLLLLSFSSKGGRELYSPQIMKPISQMGMSLVSSPSQASAITLIGAVGPSNAASMTPNAPEQLLTKI